MELAKLAPETRNLIDGRLVEASSGATFPNGNPATEEFLGVASDGTREDMLRAIAAARRTFDETEWSTNHELRARCLRQFHAALREEKEQLRAIVVAEAGACVSLTPFMHIDDPIEMVAYWAELAASYPYEQRLSDVPYLGRLFLEKTDVPAGVVNIVASSDHGLGEMLATDPRVDVVSFTGSTATGRLVMERAAATVKKVFLELGGKSANIVLDDADFAAVLPMTAFTCVHGGQGCALTTRLLLPRSRYEEGLAIVRAAFERWRYGDPTDPAHLQGPLISKRQQERVLAYIEKGRQEGARLVVGGGVPKQLPKSYYVESTLFADVDPASTIAQEEIFGPFLCVLPFDDDADAVRIANQSSYGLSGAVHSARLDRALAVARRVRTGTLSVNGAQWFHVDNPFGGYKQSGVGRENGRIGFEEYLETKLMAVPSEAPR